MNIHQPQHTESNHEHMHHHHHHHHEEGGDFVKLGHHYDPQKMSNNAIRMHRKKSKISNMIFYALSSVAFAIVVVCFYLYFFGD